MMKAFQAISLVFALLCCNAILAQPPCAFDVVHSKMLQNNTEYARQVNLNELSIQRYISDHPELLHRTNRTESIYTIPVVVHVMHTGGAIGSIYNPTDAQIIGAITYLNQVFAGTYAGMTAPVEGGGVVNMELQFALAQRTPTCGYTNGIDRVDASSLPNYTTNGVNAQTSSGCPDVTMKNLSRWNTADYYNIWVVNKIDGADGTSGQFIAGYAYFPGASSSVDGTVMLATQMISGQKTLPHEIGHALNLYHTFEGSANNTQCPLNTDCNTNGDRVCDTDPIYNNYNAGTGLYSFACRSGSNTCASPNNYTINTESNFMSYTSCYTLFTNGQKARAQAAMSLASRASLVSPGNLALVPCGPTINFSQSTSVRAENIVGTINGCRRYSDYTYQMTIGEAPTANATATLIYSGSTVYGLDYEITTNGDFNSPSNILTFNSGSTNSQNFTLRVYDDQSVETNETIVLDFVINSGGGNATKGTTAPTLTVTLTDNDFSPTGASNNTYSIGTIAYAIDGAPFDATLQSQKGQYLYKATELITAGMKAGSITSFQFFINSKLSIRPFSNFFIKMAQTSTTYLVNGSVNVIGGMTTVYSSSSFSTTAGWNNIPLGTPFTWDGLSNIAVEICFDNGTADGGDNADQIGAYSDGGTSSQGNMFFQDNINCSGSFGSVSFYSYGIKPIIKLDLTVTGTPIEMSAGSIASNHIQNGSQDYFYSNNDKLLFGLNNVNNSLNCVNATLDAGGTSWINAFGGQRSAKVFSVTPANNGATTGYTIALYFDNSELDGKNPVSLRIAKTSAASAGAANSSNTIFATPTITTLGSGITVFTASFTGFSKFFLVDAGATLPVSLTDFTVMPNEQKNTLVSWKTSSEYNNKDFTIETSNDAVHFTPLTTVASKGNSVTQQEYEFLHIKPDVGTTWYRLKQTDFDENKKYSKVISATINKNGNPIFLYPVPAKDLLTINLGSTIKKASIEIYTTSMQLILQENLNSPLIKKELNISSLPNGIYFIKITEPDNSTLLRFIKN